MTSAHIAIVPQHTNELSQEQKLALIHTMQELLAKLGFNGACTSNSHMGHHTSNSRTIPSQHSVVYHMGLHGPIHVISSPITPPGFLTQPTCSPPTSMYGMGQFQQAQHHSGHGQPSISVGDGHSITITNTGHSILPTPTKSLHLNNVLITPHIVKNLISIRQFVRDNNCTIEFDAFGFFVKDFLMRRVLLRCDSTGDLYPVTTPSPIHHAFLVSQHMWHQRLGHPGGEVLRRLVSSNFISYNKEKPPVLYHVC
ncbi:ribonuclease H-like domain-containing protein [Tanacetum coccineum]